jgi:large subunit ribosomal protein L54
MQRIIQRTITSSALCSQAMKAGTPIPGLNFLKGKDAPVAMERSEYPDWVGELEKSQIALAKLRRMEEADASDSDKMRYLKLTRRALIKENNLEAGAK